MNRKNRINFTTKYVLVFGALLLAAIILLGIVLYNQSRAALKSMLEKNMLDITNTASGLIDGDALAAYTQADEGGEFYRGVLQTLNVFRDRVEIEFIYAVKQVGPEEFVFTIDPDPVDPGAYGEPIIFTYALGEAGRGVATVDSAPAADRWGNFYSAYSPVFDSTGAVAGIIGVDFDAEWYARQLRQFSVTVASISVLTVLVGAAVIVLITQRTRRSFLTLESEITGLSSAVDELTAALASTPGYSEIAAHLEPIPPTVRNGDAGDEIAALSEKIRSMEDTMKRYLDYVHVRAYTDALTGVGNTTAYSERMHAIESGGITDAQFAVAVFDIDLLKEVNDGFGHACGDMIIRAAAAVITRVFGKENVYRIGGDEFLVITDVPDEAALEEQIAHVEAAAANYSPTDKSLGCRLSLSGGGAIHRAGEGGTVQDVFVRADEAMYLRKTEHHRRSRA